VNRIFGHYDIRRALERALDFSEAHERAQACGFWKLFIQAKAEERSLGEKANLFQTILEYR